MSGLNDVTQIGNVSLLGLNLISPYFMTPPYDLGEPLDSRLLESPMDGLRHTTPLNMMI
jgi:hypothetical protein